MTKEMRMVLFLFILGFIFMPMARATTTILSDDFENNDVDGWTAVGTLTKLDSSAVNPLVGTYSMRVENNATLTNKGFAVFNVTNWSVNTGVINVTIKWRPFSANGDETLSFYVSNNSCGDCADNSGGFYLDNDGTIYQAYTGGSTALDVDWGTTPTYYEYSIVYDIDAQTFDVYVNGTQKGDNDASLVLDNVNYIKIGDITAGDYIRVKVDDVTILLEAGELIAINQNSYNLTSADANWTAWRTNTSYLIPLSDNTPTVTFTTDIASNCSIGTTSLNYSAMIGGDANRKCGTTKTTSHTCTLPATDSLTNGVDQLYISCIGNSLTENGSSTSGALYANLTAVSLTMSDVSIGYTTSDGTVITNATAVSYNGSSIIYELQNDTLGKLNISSNGEINVTGLVFGDVGEYNITVNATDGTTRDEDTFLLTITGIIVDNCLLANTSAIQFKLYNEEHPSELLNGTLQVMVNYTSDYVTYETYNGTYSTNNTFLLCINPVTSTIHADIYAFSTIPTGFTQRFIVQNGSYTQEQTNYSIYNFNDTTGISDLYITTRSQESYDYYPDVLVHLQRLYAGEATWRVVQMDRTGDFGKVFFNIREVDTDYRLYFYDAQNGLLKKTDSIKFLCTSGVCDATILISETATSTASTNTVINYTYNNDTQILVMDWTAPAGTTSTVELAVTHETITGQTTVCSQTQIGAGGTMTCNLTGYNSEFFVFGEADGITVVADWLAKPQARLGSLLSSGEKVFYTALILVTITFTGLVSPVATVIAMFAGLVVVFMMGIFNVITLTFLIIVGVLSIAIGFKVKN